MDATPAERGPKKVAVRRHLFQLSRCETLNHVGSAASRLRTLNLLSVQRRHATSRTRRNVSLRAGSTTPKAPASVQGSRLAEAVLGDCVLGPKRSPRPPEGREGTCSLSGRSPKCTRFRTAWRPHAPEFPRYGCWPSDLDRFEAPIVHQVSGAAKVR